MKKVVLTLPDGKKLEIDQGQTCLDAAKKIGEGLARAALAAKLDGKAVDLSFKITKNALFQVLTFKDKEGKEVFWHSSAHLMAAAVLKLFSKARLTIGPSTEDGFFYDIDMDPIHPDQFKDIEAEMKKLVDANLLYRREEVTKAEAKKILKNQPYKIELLNEISEDVVSLYRIGDVFVDLCAGPHVPSTGRIGAFKIMKIAGAYWKGDAKNKQLQRLYGVSFPDKKDLTAHLTLLEEAEKRDHRKIGKELDLFSHDLISPGCTFFHPKGMVIYNELMKFLREEYFKRGYSEVLTPIIFNKSLWETSGHWQHYKEFMFQTESEGQQYAIKPMNCPGHTIVYSSQTRSYRDLPLRIAEFGQLHRNELSGTLSGLTRVRRFVQDDSHIFCAPEQIQSEIENLIDFINFVYKKTFGFEYEIELSTKPANAVGSAEIWAKAEHGLQQALESQRLAYKLNPGDGAFYGPKIDFHIKDALGRRWQCATIQLDFNMPGRFQLSFEGKDGKKHCPVMIHRAIFGSFERFIGMIIEHYAGKLPLWLNPNQVKILTVTDRADTYAHFVKDELRKHCIRVEVNDFSETINKKVRDAQLQQYNYILVVGDQEVGNKTVTVRTRDNVVRGAKKVDEFISELKNEVEERK